MPELADQIPRPPLRSQNSTTGLCLLVFLPQLRQATTLPRQMTPPEKSDPLLFNPHRMNTLKINTL